MGWNLRKPYQTAIAKLIILYKDRISIDSVLAPRNMMRSGALIILLAPTLKVMGMFLFHVYDSPVLARHCLLSFICVELTTPGHVCMCIFYLSSEKAFWRTPERPYRQVCCLVEPLFLTGVMNEMKLYEWWSRPCRHCYGSLNLSI